MFSQIASRGTHETRGHLSHHPRVYHESPSHSTNVSSSHQYGSPVIPVEAVTATEILCSPTVRDKTVNEKSLPTPRRTVRRTFFPHREDLKCLVLVNCGQSIEKWPLVTSTWEDFWPKIRKTIFNNLLNFRDLLCRSREVMITCKFLPIK